MAQDIIDNYFDHNINSVSKMRWRIFFNFLIKCLYATINICTFSILDLLLNRRFSSYGIDWSTWARANTSYALNFDLRTRATPGNRMLPTFGLCNVHEAVQSLRLTVADRHKIMCEVSSNILYQYVFLVLWFVLVFSMTVSIAGIFINLFGHLLSVAWFVKNDKSAKYVYKFLTFRECEYLEFVRRKNLMLFGDVIRILRQMKVPHLIDALSRMKHGIDTIVEPNGPIPNGTAPLLEGDSSYEPNETLDSSNNEETPVKHKKLHHVINMEFDDTANKANRRKEKFAERMKFFREKSSDRVLLPKAGTGNLSRSYTRGGLPRW